MTRAMKKTYIILAVEVGLLLGSVLLFIGPLSDFEYKALIVFPTFLIMSTSAVLINMLYNIKIDSDIEKEETRIYSRPIERQEHN
jgi:4-hydroxybenzoate polyprenyltransferase